MDKFRVVPYGNAVVDNQPRENWSWAVVPNDEETIGVLDCESEQDANKLCGWLNALHEIANARADWSEGVGSYAGGETWYGFAARLQRIATDALAVSGPATAAKEESADG